MSIDDTNVKWGDYADFISRQPIKDQEDPNISYDIRISYRINEKGQKIKRTEYVKIEKTIKEIPRTVYERGLRMSQNRFGAAATCNPIDNMPMQGENVYVVPIIKTLPLKPKPSVPNPKQQPNPLIVMRDEFIQKLVNLGYPLDYSERQFKYILDQLGLYPKGLSERSTGTVKCRTCGGPHWTSKCTVAPSSDSPADSPATSTNNQNNPRTPYRPPVGQDTEHEYKIKISNLSEEVDEDELRDLVNPLGSIARVQIIKDRATNVSRGFAFVTFRNKDDVPIAIGKLNGRPFNHLILNVEAARPSYKN